MKFHPQRAAAECFCTDSANGVDYDVAVTYAASLVGKFSVFKVVSLHLIALDDLRGNDRLKKQNKKKNET